MAEQNPSVVNDALGSNYNLDIDSGGLNKSELDYINQLDKALRSSPMQNVSAGDYYPTAGRGIQVGQIYNKTLGSVPLFAAGKGLLPLSLLEAKKQAVKQAELQRFAMFGPQNNPILDEYVQLSNPWAQEEFNAKLQDELNVMLDKYTRALGGDRGKAYLALKHDPRFKNVVRKYENYALGYNAVFGEALQIMQDYNDPDKWVDEKIYDKSLDLIKNHDGLQFKSIDELEKYIGEFQSYLSVHKAVKDSLQFVGTYVTNEIKERLDLSTDDTMVLENITKENIFPEDTLQQIIDDSVKRYKYIERDPELRAEFERMFKNGMAKAVKSHIETVRKDYSRKLYDFNSKWGVPGGMFVSDITMRTYDNTKQYKSPVITISPKNELNRTTYATIGADQPVYIKDEKGTIMQGQFNNEMTIKPSRIFRDEQGRLMVYGNIDVSRLGAVIDEVTGEYKGIKKGEVLFNKTGGEILDAASFGGTYDIIVPLNHIAGDLSSQFPESWNYVSSNLLPSLPEPDNYSLLKKTELLTLDQARELTDVRRRKKVINRLDEKTQETGIEYIVWDMIPYDDKERMINSGQIVIKDANGNIFTYEDLKSVNKEYSVAEMIYDVENNPDLFEFIGEWNKK